MNRRTDLPIIISHNTNTGIMAFPNEKMGGKDIVIVGLNRDFPSGDEFELQDIGWIKAVLHFGDVGSMKIMADILAKDVKIWEGEQDDEVGS